MQVFLVRAILRVYSGAVAPPRTTWAKLAWREESTPELLRVACDAWGIPLGELARAAELEQTVLAQFVMGTRPLEKREQEAVILGMTAMIGRIDRG